MPSLVFAEPGSDASFGLEFYSTSGTVTSDSGVAHTGPRSIKLDSGAGNAITWVTRTGSPMGNTRRVSFWLRVETLPSGTITIVDIRNTVALARLQLLAGGAIRLADSANASAGQSTTTLSTATWYRISIAFSLTGLSTNEFRIYINGTQEISASNTTFASNAANQILIGWGAAPGANRVMYLDDLYIDDGTYTDGDTGDMRVTVKLPSAAGAANTFDTLVGSGANRWTYVSERPWADANRIEQQATASTAENFTLEADSAGDVDISGKTIVSRMAYIRASKDATGGTSAAKITNNGTDTAITLTTSAAQYIKAVTSASYPSNAAGVGMTSTTVTANTVLYECGMIIVYLGGGTVQTGAAALVGDGTLSSAALRFVYAAGGLAGDGALTSSSLRLQNGAAALVGDGALTAPSLRLLFGVSTLGGDGALSAASLRYLYGSSALAGDGALSAASLRFLYGAAGLAGDGALVGAALKLLTGAGALSGDGALSSAARRLALGAGALSGDGTLSASARRLLFDALALTGDGALVADARRFIFAASSLAGDGALAADARRFLYAASSLAGDGALTAASLRFLYAAAALAGDGTLTATASGAAFLFGAAVLSGDGALVAASRRLVFAAAGLASDAAQTATASSLLLAAAALAGDAALSSAGVRLALAASALAADGTLASAAIRQVIGDATLAGDGALAANALRLLFGASALAADGTLTADAGRLLTAASALSADGSLTAAGELILLLLRGLATARTAGVYAAAAGVRSAHGANAGAVVMGGAQAGTRAAHGATADALGVGAALAKVA